MCRTTSRFFTFLSCLPLQSHLLSPFLLVKGERTEATEYVCVCYEQIQTYRQIQIGIERHSYSTPIQLQIDIDINIDIDRYSYSTAIYKFVVEVVVQSLSHVQLLVIPWTVACQASLSFTVSWRLLKLISIELMMPSNHFIFCHLLLLLPSIFPSTRIFSNELAHHIRWPKNWNFSYRQIKMQLQKQIYYKNLAHMIVEVDKSADLQLVSPGDSRELMIQLQSECWQA